jgi:predicted transcriptional regulator
MADTVRSSALPDPNMSDVERLRLLDEALKRGLADIEAGRVVPADEVFDRLEAKYRKMAEEAGEAEISTGDGSES